MRYLSGIILLVLAFSPTVKAESTLLESVKRDPNEARNLCKHFISLNKKGVSANSPEAISEVAKKRNLNSIDAEILSTYVIGMYCPNVR